MKPPVLLCYNLSQEHDRAIKMSAMRLRIRVFLVPKTDYAQTLSALCNLEPRNEQAKMVGSFEEELLIMGNFPSGLALQFMNLLGKAGVPKTVLKAVLTPHNAGWDSFTLYTELSKEREALGQGRRVHETEGS